MDAKAEKLALFRLRPDCAVSARTPAPRSTHPPRRRACRPSVRHSRFPTDFRFPSIPCSSGRSVGRRGGFEALAPKPLGPRVTRAITPQLAAR